ncbi:Arylsulfatase [Aureliella helgolandensis]|uniref:Arylsulfatase n=2 Tax=Aureliella helgolandensis TaxID=2527968 RepID=A0A518G821_9BACT|nr:Arylsulfatase [Aureliella helgolandensis]
MLFNWSGTRAQLGLCGVGLLCWGTLLVAPADSAEADQTRPNIVVFLVDDMGVMDTSVPFLTDGQGTPKRYPLNDYYRTPNMEKLAASGIRFNNFCAMSVCSPTRISIMTGQNAARHRATNWINPATDNRGPLGPPDWNWQGIEEGDVTLPAVLRESGYHTIHVGKAHFGPTDSFGSEPLNLGFEENVAGAAFGAPGSYYGELDYGMNHPRRANHAVPHLEAYHGTDTFLTEALTLEAKKKLAAAVADGAPFFLHMAHYAVHAPFESDPRFAENYMDQGKPANGQAFATLIEGMDRSLGMLVEQLQELGVAENTLILFLGDNGSDAPLGHQHSVACAAPLRGKKGSHYEGGMRVPFIAAWAARNEENPLQQQTPIPAGGLQSQIASVQDLFPTIAALAEADLPGDHIIDGYSLDKLLTGQLDESRPQTFLMHYPHAPHRSDYFTSYREDHWKVIYHYVPSDVSGGSHYQLYNLESDPFESTDLSVSHPEELAHMMQGLIDYLENYDAAYPLVDKQGEQRRFPQLPK